jgi:uncharacterized repeat protein (TIGR01451 family)
VSGTVTVPTTAQAIACRVTNTRSQTGELILQKSWTNGATEGPDQTTLTTTGSGAVPGGSGSTTAAVPPSGNGISDNSVVTAIASGETVHLTEAMFATNLGSYTTSLSCDAGSLDAATGELVVPAGASDITCTFSNVRVASTVRLDKVWVNPVAGDVANLFIHGPGGPSDVFGSATATAPNGATTGLVTVLSGHVITVGETLPATNTGAYTASIACTPAGVMRAGTGGLEGSFTVPATETTITCTVTNTRAATGELTLEKTWTNGLTGDSATLTATGSGVVPGGNGSTVAHVPSGGSGTSIDMVVIAIASGETVHLTETKPAANLGSYTTTLSCNAGTLDAATGALTVPSAPHGNITCTFANARKLPELAQGKTVDKQTAAVGDTLTYTVKVVNHGAGSAFNVVAHDTLPPNLAFVSADTGGFGTYDSTTGTWTIPVLPAGTTAVLTIVATVLPGASGQTLTNRLVVEGATTVNDPCPDDPSRSCATTVIASPVAEAPAAGPGAAAPPPSGPLPFTGQPLLDALFWAAILGALGAAFVAASRRRQRSSPAGRHFKSNNR